MDQPFIYKYKPNNIENFEMDNNLLEILNTFIQIDNLNIILHGNSGTGKTTLINCIINKYYNISSDMHYDNNNIMIINALKDQGIAYYRNEVKTFCQIMCTIPNKKKTIVIDDIDTINEQSQQVFRNCIDNYSANVNFIMSCCNIHKVIDSLQSRIVILKIHYLNINDLNNIIMKICKCENIKLTDEAKSLVIKISNNSVRTIINYLEKFKLLSEDIDYDTALNVCTNISLQDLYRYTEICKKNKNIDEAIQILYNMCDSGYSVMDILDNYFIFVKYTDLLKEDEKYRVIKLLCKYITIFYNIHEDEIELVFFTNNLINILD